MSEEDIWVPSEAVAAAYKAGILEGRKVQLEKDAEFVENKTWYAPKNNVSKFEPLSGEEIAKAIREQEITDEDADR